MVAKSPPIYKATAQSVAKGEKHLIILASGVGLAVMHGGHARGIRNRPHAVGIMGNRIDAGFIWWRGLWLGDRRSDRDVDICRVYSVAFASRFRGHRPLSGFDRRRHGRTRCELSGPGGLDIIAWCAFVAYKSECIRPRPLWPISVGAHRPYHKIQWN